MIGKMFLPPKRTHMKVEGSYNNCDVPGTHHFHMRYGGQGPPSLSWSGLFGYTGMTLGEPENASIWDDTSVAKLKKEIYMVSHAGPSEPFWSELFKGAFFGAKKNDIKLKILYPRVLGDYASQLRIIERLIEQSPMTIATTLPDPDSFLPVLRRAQEKGIPILLFNSKNIRKGKLTRLPFPSIGIDDYRVGQMAALRALKTQTIRDRVVVLNYLKGPKGFEQRFSGIVSVLKPQNIKIDHLLIRPDMEDSHLKFKRYLEETRDCSAVFILRGSVLSAVKDYLLDYPAQRNTAPLTCVTFDKTNLATSLLELGFVTVCIDIRPFLQGYLSINVPPKSFRLKPLFFTSRADLTAYKKKKTSPRGKAS